MAATPTDPPGFDDPGRAGPSTRQRQARAHRLRSWFFAGLCSCTLAVGSIGLLTSSHPATSGATDAATAGTATVATAQASSATQAADLANVDTDSLTSNTTSTTASTSSEAATASTAITDVNGDGNLRVLLVGDSIMWGAKDDIAASLEAQGVEVQYFGWPGTGLLTDQTWWIDSIASSVSSFAPDVVVIESCCNYQGDFTLSDGSTLTADSELMYQLWQTRAEQAVERAKAGGAQVYFVLTPDSVPGAELTFPAERIDRFNAIYRQLGVDLIDWNAVVNGSTTTEDLHEQDGLHLTTQGYAAIAQATVDRILGTTS